MFTYLSLKPICALIEKYYKIKRPKNHDLCNLLICRSNIAGFGFFKTKTTIVFFSLFKYVLSNMVRQQNSPIKLYICNYVVCTRFNTASRTLSTLGQSTAVEKNRKQNFAQFFKQKVPID